MEQFGDYTNRVKTFTLQVWQMRHYKLTPTKIARWGFQCLNSSTLQCNQCQELLSLTDFSLLIEDVVLKDTLYKKFIAQLPKAHHENCLFQGLKKDNTLLFKINREFLFQHSLRLYQDNITTLKEIKKIPQIKSELLQIIPENLQIVLYDSPFDYENKKLNALKCYAIFGWRVNIQEEQNENEEQYLSCIFCGRSVQSAKFDISDVYQTQSSSRRQFDLIEEHRYFCKWANNDPFSNKLYGYSILIQQLYDQYLQSNPTLSASSNKNSMVQITVLRRELVTQLESLKKDQQQLTQELDIIEQENQGFIDRLGKRKRKDLEEMIEDKAFHDQLEKKIKAQEQDKIQRQQLEEEQKLLLENSKQLDNQIMSEGEHVEEEYEIANIQVQVNQRTEDELEKINDFDEPQIDNNSLQKHEQREEKHSVFQDIEDFEKIIIEESSGEIKENLQNNSDFLKLNQIEIKPNINQQNDESIDRTNPCIQNIQLIQHQASKDQNSEEDIQNIDEVKLANNVNINDEIQQQDTQENNGESEYPEFQAIQQNDIIPNDQEVLQEEIIELDRVQPLIKLQSQQDLDKNQSNQSHIEEQQQILQDDITYNDNPHSIIQNTIQNDDIMIVEDEINDDINVQDAEQNYEVEFSDEQDKADIQEIEDDHNNINQDIEQDPNIDKEMQDEESDVVLIETIPQIEPAIIDKEVITLLDDAVVINTQEIVKP